MSRMLYRAVAALLALPLAATIGTSTAAADEITVPGCYGVSVVVCDPTVEYTVPAGVETYSTLIPVCAGACQDVRVTLVRVTGGQPLSLCVSYESRLGAVTRRCAEVPDTSGLVDTVVELVVDAVAGITDDLPDVDQLREDLLDALRELVDRLPTRDEIADAIERLRDTWVPECTISDIC